jgi:hypothetical protein
VIKRFFFRFAEHSRGEDEFLFKVKVEELKFQVSANRFIDVFGFKECLISELDSVVISVFGEIIEQYT